MSMKFARNRLILVFFFLPKLILLVSLLLAKNALNFLFWFFFLLNFFVSPRFYFLPGGCSEFP